MTRIDTRWSFLSHRAVVMENRMLRVVVLPELGGRIWSIVYKPRDRELLWQNPRVPPQKVPSGAVFDDVWCGGWEEMFPNAAPGSLQGETYSDHGEVWPLTWESEVRNTGGSLRLALQTSTPIRAASMEKRLTLREDAPCLEIVYTLRNHSAREMPYIFALHPAFAVTPACRLDLPAMQMDLEPSFPGTLTETKPRFEWPYATRRGEKVDLRTVYPATSGEIFFLYGHNFKEGWSAITDTDERLSWGCASRLNSFARAGYLRPTEAGGITTRCSSSRPRHSHFKSSGQWSSAECRHCPRTVPWKRPYGFRCRRVWLE